ncbi:MAG TPA: CoA transferase, partial [Parvularculaceae bacterium]|nr:CoA transferase [Parvularculaceae bacterium]
QFDKASWPDAKERLAAVFREKPRAHWVRMLEGADVCFAPVLSPSEAAAHHHMKARRVYRDIAGVLQAAAAPRFDNETPANPGPIPPSGVHTEEILKEAGYSEEEIKNLF